MTMTAMLARLALGRNYSSGRGTEEPVAGVTQPWHDEAVLVQVLVHGRACHLHRRMMAAKQVESRLGRDQAERMDLGGAPFLDEVADPHQRTSRRQHRVAYDHAPTREVAGKPFQVHHGEQRLLVTAQPDRKST